MLSSMIVYDRGAARTLTQMYYGDEESGYGPTTSFVEALKKYPDIWEVAQNIEGLVVGRSSHAGGVIFTEESLIESVPLMRTPKGEIITQFDLHDCEAVSLIKYDLLSVSALDKIRNCIDLLVKFDRVEDKGNLKDTYESVIGVYNLIREDIDMWKMVWEHKIYSLFQMDEQSGIQGIALTYPRTIDELAVLNSVIRLMATERGAEQPLDKYARFRADEEEWDRELAQYKLGEKEKAILEPIIGISNGLCIFQEQFMELVQLPELGGFDLQWADKLRKSIAKKDNNLYDELTKEYFNTVKEKGCDIQLCGYVWNVLIAMNRGYGFNASHTLAYSILGLQEMNLAYRFPICYWNTACLIVDSGGVEEEDNDSDLLDYIFEEVEHSEDNIVTFSQVEEENEDEDEEEAKKKGKKAKKKDYGAMATAIGSMVANGITIAPPNINKSEYTFVPDESQNAIVYGLAPISRIGEKLTQDIIANRPYTSLEDLLNKVKLNKTQTINLIKSGALDVFGEREEIMDKYMEIISEPKKTVNLRNMQMLMRFGLLPDEELEFEKKVFNFNKYLKKFKVENEYLVNNIAYNFYSKHFELDLLTVRNDNELYISAASWKNIYDRVIDKARQYIKANKDILLVQLNQALKQEMIDKYALGNKSKWEMDSISCYIDKHELDNLNYITYDIQNFFKLPEEPIVSYSFEKNGKIINMLEINRIAGTVIDKNKNKKTVTLLTREGVVKVKLFGQMFTHYDKQLSKLDPVTNKKKVIEKSWISRGNKIMVTGIRRGETFIAKKYKNTPYHMVELITSINENGEVEKIEERVEIE